MYPLPKVLPKFVRRYASLFVCAGSILAAGCHHNGITLSDYGFGWVTVANGSGSYGNNVQFASYVVTVDSVVLNDAVGNQYSAIQTYEPVDFVKLTNIAELWGSATIPADTYVSATITIDYSNAAVALLVNGVPTAATVKIPGDATLTTVSVTVTFDPANPLVITNSYATTNAQRVALDFDLAASNVVDLTTSPATVTATPFFRISNTAADTRLIRVRGPLVNSDAVLSTYSVYERPFYDEASSVGTLTLFTTPQTLYTINGTAYRGASAYTAISELSAGVTATEAYTTFEVTPSTINVSGQPTNTAGKFIALYSVMGGSLETNYTENVEGDVIARTGNTLTLANSTLAGAQLQLQELYFQYIPASTTNPAGIANVLIGPGTIVTAEGNASLAHLDYNSIAVGQHITAIGNWVTGATFPTIDAVIQTTGSTAGQVRLQSTRAFGQLQSTAAGDLTMTLQTIDGLPASLFNFTGDGSSAAQDPTASAYLVDTTNSGADLSAAAAGTSLWIDGFTAGFGAAPPDFSSFPNLKLPAAPGDVVSGINAEAAVPASLQLVWVTGGTTTPFASASGASVAIDGTDAALASAVIAIGPEVVALASLGAPVTVVPNTVANCVATSNTKAQPCAPLFAFSTVTTAATSTTPALTAINEYNGFAAFITALNAHLTTAAPALQMVANGYFDRTTNTFTANSIDFVL